MHNNMISIINVYNSVLKFHIFKHTSLNPNCPLKGGVNKGGKSIQTS